MSDSIPETVFKPLLQHLMQVQEAELHHTHAGFELQPCGTCPRCDQVRREQWRLQQREVTES